jgi:pyruvate formate lyase activating enzyme
VDRDVISDFLHSRRGLLDGVVISGGEPTLQTGLFHLCGALKELGYAVKLDTNGSRPEVIHEILKAGLVDYIAMDFKAEPENYSLCTSRKAIAAHIRRSIEVIMELAPDYEFRTTCIKPLINTASMRVMAGIIKGAAFYALQRFKNEKVLAPDFFNDDYGRPCREFELDLLRSIALDFVETCVIR